MQGREQPGLGRIGIGQGFQGGEGLGRDDEKRGFGVERFERDGQVRRVQIRYKVHPYAFQGVVIERGAHHGRAQVGTADPDIDHVAYGLACVSQPTAVMNRLDETLHATQYLGDLGLDIHAFHPQWRPGRGTQRSVQNRTVLREIDALATHHRVTLFRQARFHSQLLQQVQGIGGDAVFRIIEQEVAAAQREAAEPLRILAKGGAHVEIPHGFVMRFKRFPGREVFERSHGWEMGVQARKVPHGLVSDGLAGQFSGRPDLRLM